MDTAARVGARPAAGAAVALDRAALDLDEQGAEGRMGDDEVDLPVALPAAGPGAALPGDAVEDGEARAELGFEGVVERAFGAVSRVVAQGGGEGGWVHLGHGGHGLARGEGSQDDAVRHRDALQMTHVGALEHVRECAQHHSARDRQPHAQGAALERAL